MVKRVQHVRHSTAAADLYIGLVGEITVDTDGKTLRLHDGVTAGGKVIDASATLTAALTSLNVLTPAADRVAYYTSPSAAALATFTSYGRSLVATADEEEFKSFINSPNKANKIRNPAMQISTRGTSFTNLGALNINPTLDSWGYSMQGGPQARVDITQSTVAPIAKHFSLKIDCQTAEAVVAAGESFEIEHRIEAKLLQDLQWGTSGAKAVTLSFWYRSPKTGIHCVALRNDDANRAIVKEFTINSANTFEFKKITFPADTSGAGFDNNTGIGMYIRFPLIAGSNFHGTADVWGGSTNVLATANQQNLLDNTANDIYIALVKLEIGSVASPFVYGPPEFIADQLFCLRYLVRRGITGSFDVMHVGQNTATTALRTPMALPVPMRATPTLGTTGVGSDYRVTHGGSTITACSAVPTYTATDNINNQHGHVDWTVASGLTAGAVAFAGGAVNGAYLQWSAEL
jgi:hypothetical protein